MMENPEEPGGGNHDSLLATLLHEQQTVTAIDEFARSYPHSQATGERPGHRQYRDLIPAGLPGDGQQYAFEVDLDACSGCKACVAACHSLNGLEDGEVWRNVGQLIGGEADSPLLQHVTTACHHCVEPACLHGCPVEAYEKDPLTGIVRHLDDQCIGCQYCILKCPYDVPVYSKSKGIVRKCDMCQGRLASGEAPACVQSCPNGAIRIRIADESAIVEASEADQFLPAAPSPTYTLPATSYRSGRALPRNALPADYFSVQRSHGHLALVVMLVLTQMSVGAFVVEQMTHGVFTTLPPDMSRSVRPLHLAAALLLGGLGLIASVFHLGRPLYAYRALLGLRTSWLSREILAFGLFAATATAYVASACWRPLFGVSASAELQNAFGALAVLIGIAAVACSVIIYVDTRRPYWTWGRTASLFLLTSLILGAPTALLVSLVAAGVSSQITLAEVMTDYGGGLCRLLIAAVAVKLAIESSVLIHLRDRRCTSLQRTAMLLTRQLSMVVVRRYFFGIVGGLVIPAILLSENAFAMDGYHPLFLAMATLLSLILLTVGELHERYLFFAASAAPRMPGGPAA